MKPQSLLAILLGVMFIGLKLTGFIDWSWVWVVAPFWLGSAVLVSFILLMFIVVLVAGLIVKIDDRRKLK